MKKNSKQFLRKVSSIALAAALAIGTTAAVPFAAVFYGGSAGITANAADEVEFVNTSHTIQHYSEYALNDRVSISKSSEGGEGTVTYNLACEDPDGQPVSFTRSYFVANKTGEYTITVTAVDSLGREAVKEIKVNVVESEPEIIYTPTLSAETIVLGQSVTITHTAEGGLAPLLFDVRYSGPDHSTYTFTYHSSDSATVFTPEYAGTYTFLLRANGRHSDCYTDATLTLNVQTPTDAISNTSTIGRQSMTEGISYKVNLSAEGGSGSYTYDVSYRKQGTSDWIAYDHYSDDNCWFYPAIEGMNEIRINATDSEGNEDAVVYEVMVYPDFNNCTVTVSPETAKVNEEVTITVNPNGGDGNYKNSIRYKSPDGGIVTLRNNSADNTATFTPVQEGTYTVYAETRDSNGRGSGVYIASLEVTNIEPTPLENKSKVSTLGVLLSDSVTITCAAEGGTAPYTYEVLYKKSTDTKWAMLSQRSSETTVIFTPKKAVNYDICVRAYDADDSCAKKYYKYDINKEIAAIGLNVTINNKPAQPGTPVVVPPKTPIVVYAQAEGSNASFQYAVFYKKVTDEKWARVQDFDNNDTVTIHPAKAVMYDVCVKVKDARGHAVKAYYKVDIRNLITVAAELSSDEIIKGEAVTVTCSASNGTEPYTYKVLYKKSTDKNFAVVQDFSESTTATLKPSKAPLYDIRVVARDATGDEGFVDLQVVISDFQS